MLDRSAKVAQQEDTQAWAYEKTSVMEELGDNGKVLKTTEKIHRVVVFRGVPFSKLVQVRGRALSNEELEKENRREAEFRKRISGRDPNHVAARKEALIMKDLVDRYEFRVIKRSAPNGRPTLEMTFAVKPDWLSEKDKSIQDRILNRLAGTVWLDEETSEVARLNVRLTKGFSLGLLGILGSLSDCRFTLVRQPMPDGTWLPLTQETQLTARKLANSIHFRLKEQSKNFQKEQYVDL